ncbi:MAG TPA: hypothetical protein VJ256_04435, partial [Dehalococcoidia bacterium]|nr:hypothetical protein [Dehalococcoidia bacterium]
MKDYLDAGLEGLGDRYPDVWNRLERAKTRLRDSDSPDDYQSVGLLCRDAWIAYADAIFSPDFVPDGAEIPTKDETHKKIDV